MGAVSMQPAVLSLASGPQAGCRKRPSCGVVSDVSDGVWARPPPAAAQHWVPAKTEIGAQHRLVISLEQGTRGHEVFTIMTGGFKNLC